MRRFLLLISAIIFFLNCYGQRKVDFVVTITDPIPGQSIKSGEKFNATFHYLNNGPDSIIKGDSLLFEIYYSGDLKNNIYTAEPVFSTKFVKGDTGSIAIKGISLNVKQDASSTICVIAIVENRSKDSVRDISDSTGECVPVSLLTGMENSIGIIDKMRIFPNPANQSALISYETARYGNVNLALYDMEGKIVTTIVNEAREAGKYDYILNTALLQPGVYIYKFSSENEFTNGKIVVAR